jgi:hypothetical protein
VLFRSTALMDNLNADSLNVCGAVNDQKVLLSLMLFHKYQARINIFSEENFTIISIGLPYHGEKAKKKEI